MSDITQDELKSLLQYNEETGIFTWKVKKAIWFKENQIAGSKETKGYLQIKIDGKTYMAHRLAWLYVHGEWPKNQIDHINRVKDDNKISNLRVLTQSENMQNRMFRGTHFRKDSKKWQAHITFPDGKFKRLGHFDSEEKAHEAYLKAKKQFHTFLPLEMVEQK